MRVSYQLYDEKGTPTQQGIYEYWWAAPDTYRSSWSRGGQTETNWNLHGARKHLSVGPLLAFFERKLQSYLIEAIPGEKELDPANAQLVKREVKLSDVKLPCVMVVPTAVEKSGQTGATPTGLFPTYCFDSQRPILRSAYAFGSTEVIYNKISRVQGRLLPREIAILEGPRKVLTATVDAVEIIAATSPEFTPDGNAISDSYLDPNPVANMGPRKIAVSSGVSAQNLVFKIAPYYPQEAKTDHVQGTVVLRGTIGTDGHVHDLSVVQAPSTSLASSAMWAVSQWIYKPYLLKGSPVEVDTTINVVFKLGE